MATVPTMTAVVCDRYGPPEVLRVCQVPTPSPKPDEVRVRIIASAVTASDIFIRSAHVSARLQVPFRLMMGVTKPRHSILGFVFSGVIDQTGAKTSRFTPGDAVYGGTGFRLGAYAEYRCMIDSDSRTHGTLALKPTNLTHEQATAAAYGGLLALQYVDKGAIQPGQHVLIYGASGTSGTLAIQYAKSLGAHVTAVCSTKNLDLVRSLGADQVLDYTRVNTPPQGASYALVLDLPEAWPMAGTSPSTTEPDQLPTPGATHSPHRIRHPHPHRRDYDLHTGSSRSVGGTRSRSRLGTRPYSLAAARRQCCSCPGRFCLMAPLQSEPGSRRTRPLPHKPQARPERDR